MSYGPAHSVDAHDSDAGGHFALWFFGVLGALLIATGLWLSLAPTSGELSFGFTTTDVAEISDLLGPSLLLAGGVILAGAMGAGTWRDYWFDEGWMLVLIQGILGLVGVAAVVLGLLGILDRLDLYSFPGLPI